MRYTAVCVEHPEGGYEAFVEEVAGTKARGATIAEAVDNVKKALAARIEDLRGWHEQENAGREVMSETLEVSEVYKPVDILSDEERDDDED